MAQLDDTSGSTIRQRSAWLIPAGVFLVTFVLALFFLLYYLAPAPRSFFHEQVRFTPETAAFDLDVHGHHFHIPGNYLKYKSDRQDGSRKEVKLVALLPDMQGYTADKDYLFRSNSVDSPVVELLIHDDPVKLSEEDWLRRIYMPYVSDPEGTSGPFGLTAYTFRDDSGYRNEDLFVASQNHKTVVMHCARASQQMLAPNCHRELPIGHGVALSYRFKRAY
ncbi:MAG: hypothetical protein JOZ55_06275, partial [Alphaproteobacteria bacterium]|nr:hypothetical protein [Alphaproteobacteria bacterium]